MFRGSGRSLKELPDWMSSSWFHHHADSML
jgi:hypothetical protein